MTVRFSLMMSLTAMVTAMTGVQAVAQARNVRPSASPMVVIDSEHKDRIRGNCTLARVWADQIPIRKYMKSVINIKESMNQWTDVTTTLASNTKLDSPRLHDLPVIFILAEEGFILTPPERQNVKKYLLDGGFIFCDNALGTYSGSPVETSFLALIRYALGDDVSFEPIESGHDFYHCFYDFDEGVPTVYSGKMVNSGRLSGIRYKDRLVAVYSNKGYSVTWDSEGSDILSLKIAVNSIIFALTQDGGKAVRTYRSR